ncbi:MAG: cobyric acid synthase [Deltaproteobacteria bacterium]|nr:cobyric acid synthase [Deltaproteobacteria bacterium]
MPAKTLMIQGTASSVGKSILVTALCRILRQDGWNVAPFKAQNMSLNSFVTRDGGEIGRAQVVQAEACGVEPTVAMNPILLKPEADNCSQVVVKGKPLGNMPARDYYALREQLWKVITESLDSLSAQYDVVLIEGAGSPAEVNLKERDMVNMRVALYCQAPVLLAADIDRGGIFASLVGTLELLEPHERALIKAFVINKFRGDLSLLRPGLKWLEDRTRVPVAGVIPYYHDIHIAEEDSVSLERRRAMKARSDYVLDIAVVGLPHISNFDDFDPLELENGVRLRYVEHDDALGEPDLIILPGTKSTMADLATIRSTGLAQKIIHRAERDTPVIGICGGYQMLGQMILDPGHVESARPQTAGLGLLPVTTTFFPVKSTHQVRAHVISGMGLLQGAAGLSIKGYEIHMAQTTGKNMAAPFCIDERSRRPCRDMDGSLSHSGNVLGTYLHAIFHNEEFRRSILTELAARKGLTFHPAGKVFSKDEQYDRLAALVRGSLDMELIYRTVGLKGTKMHAV